jgi:23S rRNA (guanosine2251-2'-O)-methyltransferase
LENYIFGIHPLTEYISNGDKPERVLIQQGLKGSNFQQLFSLIRNNKIPFQMVPPERLNKFKKQNHQGIVAFIPHIAYQSLETIIPAIIDSGATPLLVLLDGITDVRNMGAIARSAECAGAHAIVIGEKGSAPVNADAIKASAGALSRIPVCKESGIVYAISFLKACGITILALDDRAKQSIYETKLSGPLAIVMGSEDRGVSSAAKKNAGSVAAIPMKGQIASLNVSVATGIVLFEAMRQRMNK